MAARAGRHRQRHGAALHRGRLGGGHRLSVAGFEHHEPTSQPGKFHLVTQQGPEFRRGQPLNILVMGTDSREVLGTGEYGDPEEFEGARSDTTILIHVAADRKSATAVSIPRDTIVDIPSCPRYVGGPSEPVEDRFNEAFNIAGPFCTVQTVEKLAGVDIDHFVIVDFNGFKGVVDALDGVEVCLKEPVDDPLSGLKLPAGTSVVKGDDALAFVRARYTLGDGSDLGRIERQQAFLGSALRKPPAPACWRTPSPLTACWTKRRSR